MATIKEIQQRLELVTDLFDPFLAEAANDQRSGVQKAIEKRKRAIQAELDEDLRLEQMLQHEKELYKAGYQTIAGIDEVGRGPLAGPVVAAAVILPPGCKIKGLNDSKKIPKNFWEFFNLFVFKVLLRFPYRHISFFFNIFSLNILLLLLQFFQTCNYCPKSFLNQMAL